MSRFIRRHETPAYIEDGIAYYPNWRTRRALREVERYERGKGRLRRHEPLVSRNPKGSDRDGDQYVVIETAQFRRDVKRLRKQGADLTLLDRAIRILAEGGVLPPSYRDHALGGNLTGRRECHIRPDWLFEYSIDEGRLELIAIRTGSHSELFHER